MCTKSGVKCHSTSSPPSLLRGSLHEINFKYTKKNGTKSQLISLAYSFFLLDVGNGNGYSVQHCVFVEHSVEIESLLSFPVQLLDHLYQHSEHSEER